MKCQIFVFIANFLLFFCYVVVVVVVVAVVVAVVVDFLVAVVLVLQMISLKTVFRVEKDMRESKRRNEDEKNEEMRQLIKNHFDDGTGKTTNVNVDVMKVRWL